MEFSVGHPNLWVAVSIVLILVGTFLISKLFRKIFKVLIKNQEIHHLFIQNVFSFIIYFCGIILAIKQIPEAYEMLSTVLAGSGLIAVVVGFAAQESLANIISGWFISIFQPFEVGDRVKLVDNNIVGTIEDITSRHTVIKTFINSRVIVPNSVMSTAIIENSHIVDERASSFLDVYVSYDSDVERAREIIGETIKEHPLVIDVRSEEDIASGVLQVNVMVREFGSYGIGLRASVWTANINDNFSSCSEIRLKILERFREEGIKIPTTNHIGFTV